MSFLDAMMGLVWALHYAAVVSYDEQLCTNSVAVFGVFSPTKQ